MTSAVALGSTVTGWGSGTVSSTITFRGCTAMTMALPSRARGA
jgi:hypothetical protein